MKEAGVIVSELEDFVTSFDEHLEESNGSWPEELTDPLEIFHKLKEILGWEKQ